VFLQSFSVFCFLCIYCDMGRVAWDKLDDDDDSEWIISTGDSLSIFKSRLKTFFIHSGFHWILIRFAASASEVTTVWSYNKFDYYYYYYYYQSLCQ